MKPEFTIHEWRLIAIALASVKRSAFIYDEDKEHLADMALKVANYTGQFDKDGNPK